MEPFFTSFPYLCFWFCKKGTQFFNPEFFNSSNLNCLLMKSLYLTSTLLFLALGHSGMTGRAKFENSTSGCDLKGISSSDIAEFLVNSSDLHLTAVKEGEAAIEKGTVADIKAYGELIVKDQMILLLAIKELAKSRQINIPENLSEESEEDLEELRSKSGVAFNKAFLRMIESVEKQNLKDFQKAATKLEDKEISAFASRNIHLINLELIRLEKIKAKM